MSEKNEESPIQKNEESLESLIQKDEESLIQKDGESSIKKKWSGLIQFIKQQNKKHEILTPFIIIVIITVILILIWLLIKYIINFLADTEINSKYMILPKDSLPYYLGDKKIGMTFSPKTNMNIKTIGIFSNEAIRIPIDITLYDSTGEIKHITLNNHVKISQALKHDADKYNDNHYQYKETDIKLSANEEYKIIYNTGKLPIIESLMDSKDFNLINRFYFDGENPTYFQDGKFFLGVNMTYNIIQ